MNVLPIIRAALAVGLAGSSLRAAGTLALWTCAPPPGPARVLADAGPHRLALELDPRATFVAGRFGQAWRPLGPARAARGWPRPECWSGSWTIECWLRLDVASAAEAVILELVDGLVVLRFGVLPAENAFLWTAPAADPGPGVAARRVELARSDGPPGEVVWLRDATLDLRPAALPRERWLHVALVHAPGARLRLFLDGRVAAVADWRGAALPAGSGARLTLGASADGSRILAGALQDVRVSEQVVYAGEFTPPDSPLQP